MKVLEFFNSWTTDSLGEKESRICDKVWYT